MKNEIKQPVKAIADGAIVIRTEASKLADCIVAFENILNRLPGKVNLMLEDIGTGKRVQYSRQGKEWVFQIWRSGEWESMKAASIVDKMALIKLFPTILQTMKERQDAMVQEIKDTVEGYIAFESTIDIPELGNQK